MQAVAMNQTRAKSLEYCMARWVPSSSAEERRFLTSEAVQNLVGNQGHNSGAIGEWAVNEIVNQSGLTYEPQIFVRGSNNAMHRPDGFIPELGLYVEVKTRCFFGRGSSVHLDNVPRKYSKICHDGRQAIVVFAANQMNERSGRALLDGDDPYVKDFLSLSRKHGIVDWLPLTGLQSFLVQRQRCASKPVRADAVVRRPTNVRAALCMPTRPAMRAVAAFCV
jgi:hypothetical protein